MTRKRTEYYVRVFLILFFVGLGCFCVGKNVFEVQASDEGNTAIMGGFNATTGTDGINTSEGYKMLVDNNPNTKWCSKSRIAEYSIEFNVGNSIVPKGYVLTTGNDTASYETRNPKNWELYGKLNETDGWESIAKVQNDTILGAENNKAYEFDIKKANQKEYKYFKLELKNLYGDIMQLSEFQFVVDDFFISYAQYTSECVSYSTTVGSKIVIKGNGWTYTKNVTSGSTTDEVTALEVKNKLGLSQTPDLSVCNIWIEGTIDEKIYKISGVEKNQPSLSMYATKSDLMTKFSLNDDNSTVGKVMYGKDDDGKKFSWYILGSDSEVSGDNMVIFAASPLGLEVKFNENYTDTTVDGVIKFANNYEISNVRKFLQEVESSARYFSNIEMSLLNRTAVTTINTWNNQSYETNDKLYLLAGEMYAEKICAGSKNDKEISIKKINELDMVTEPQGSIYWLRTPETSTVNEYVRTWQSSSNYYNEVLYTYVVHPEHVRPATNIDLTSVLFASAAETADEYEGTAVSKIIDSDASMTLRLDGSNKAIGSFMYNKGKNKILFKKDADASGMVNIVIQGKEDDKDWFYAESMSSTEYKAIDSEYVENYLKNKGITKGISFSACKIWIETTIDGMRYAINEPEEATPLTSIDITDVFEPDLDNIFGQFAYTDTKYIKTPHLETKWYESGKSVEGNVQAGKAYTVSIDVDCKDIYYYTSDVVATINGKRANVVFNNDGSITVTYTYAPLVAPTDPASNTTNGNKLNNKNVNNKNVNKKNVNKNIKKAGELDKTPDTRDYADSKKWIIFMCVSLVALGVMWYFTRYKSKKE